MKPSPSPLRVLQVFAALVVALALWISGVHGFMHHHHDDYQTHGDCAFCQVLGSSVTLPGAPATAATPVVLATIVAGPVPEAVTLPTRLLRLRAPSTSPPPAHA